MPEGPQHSSPALESEAQISPIERQRERWQKLREGLADANDLSYPERIYLAENVLGNSIPDGLGIIEAIGLGRADVLSILSRSRVHITKPDLYMNMRPYLAGQSDERTKRDVGLITKAAKRAESNYGSPGEDWQRAFSPKFQKLWADIDEYYAQFLPARAREKPRKQNKVGISKEALRPPKVDGVWVGEQLVFKIDRAQNGGRKMLDLVANMEQKLASKALKRELEAGHPGWELVQDEKTQLWDWVKKETKRGSPTPKLEQKGDFDFDLSKFEKKEWGKQYPIKRVFRSGGRNFITTEIERGSPQTGLKKIVTLLEMGKPKVLNELDSSTADSLIIADKGPAWVRAEGAKKVIRYPDGTEARHKDIKCLTNIGGKLAYGAKFYNDDVWYIDQYPMGAQLGLPPIRVGGELERIIPIQGSDEFNWISRYPDGSRNYVTSNDAYPLHDGRDFGEIIKVGNEKFSTFKGPDGKWFVVGEKAIVDGPFDEIKHLTKVGDGYAYAAKEGSVWRVHNVKNGVDEVTPDMSEPAVITNVNGKLCYWVKMKHGQSILVYDRKVSGSFHGLLDEEIIDLQADEKGVVLLVEEKDKYVFYTYDFETQNKGKFGKAEISPEELKRIGDKIRPFLLKDVLNWNGMAHKIDSANIEPRLVLPGGTDYERLATNERATKCGEYTLNPETQDINWETIPESKIKVIELDATWSNIRKPEVVKHLVATYGATHYLPGIEYMQYLSEHQTKIPAKLLDGNWHHFFGSIVCSEDQNWKVPSVALSRGKWTCSGDYLWNSMLGQRHVVLIEKPVSSETTGESEVDQGGNPLITEADWQKFKLLNAVSSADKELVAKYTEAYMGPPTEEERKKELGESESFKDFVNEGLKAGKKYWLETIAGKREGKREARMLAEYLFPEIKRERERQRQMGGWFGGSGGGRERPAPRAQDYLSAEGGKRFRGGDPMKKGVEVMRTRELVGEPIVSELLAGYNKETGVFETAQIPIAPELDEPVREHTFTLPTVSGMREVNLPYLLGGQVIPERVRGIKADGSEVALSMDLLPTGGARVTLEAGVMSLAYSVRKSQLPSVPEHLSEREYERFSKDVERRYRKQFNEKVAPLPSELALFVKSIQKLGPQEKLVAIENEVRRIGYYDFGNTEEVESRKDGLSLEELFGFMQERMEEIRASKPELSAELKNKLYAGVCNDFGKLVFAMMREAGIESGVISAFLPTGTSVTTDRAHLLGFALWPAEGGKFKIVPVDGTPGGVTESEQKLLANIQRPALAEQIKVYKEKTETLLREASERFKEIEKFIASNDVEKIRGLSNGELEKIVNTILRYGVKESHLATLRTILDASQYSPLNLRNLDLSDPTKATEFASFVADEIRRGREHTPEPGKGAGSVLFSLIEQFIKRNGPGSTKQLERVFDLISPSLDEIESRAFIATLKYLEARRVS